MKIRNYRELVIDGAHEEVLHFNTNSIGDTTTSEVYVELDADCEVVAVGAVSSASTTMNLIDMATYKVVEKATKAGIYLIPVGSLKQMTLAFNGSANVAIKEIF